MKGRVRVLSLRGCDIQHDIGNDADASVLHVDGCVGLDGTVTKMYCLILVLEDQKCI
jgi:hypothetical protein